MISLKKVLTISYVELHRVRQSIFSYSFPPKSLKISLDKPEDLILVIVVLIFIKIKYISDFEIYSYQEFLFLGLIFATDVSYSENY